MPKPTLAKVYSRFSLAAGFSVLIVIALFVAVAFVQAVLRGAWGEAWTCVGGMVLILLFGGLIWVIHRLFAGPT